MINTASKNIDPKRMFFLNRSEIIGRIDATAYKDSFSFSSKIFKTVKLSEIAFINPITSFSKLNPESEITFVPMEAVDDNSGTITQIQTKKVRDTKGFTRFQENDLIWAKITPCMQNGKSAVVRNTLNGFACGSTEFFIIRPKGKNVLVDYLHYLLRDQKILDTAQNYFGGSAGQQRVSKEFLLNFNVPMPSLAIQKSLVTKFQSASVLKRQKEVMINELQLSIDLYLLGELGISVPSKKNNLQDRIFTSSFSDITGGRFDPKLYDQTTKGIRNAISNSKYTSFPLKKFLTQSSAGDWGQDENETLPADFIKCLVIRATEFDNNGNLNLDNSRVKHRLIHKEKLKKIDIQKNDLLIEKSGGSPDQPVGRIALITQDHIDNNQLCYSNFIHKIRVDSEKLNPEYLFYFLKMVHNIKLTEAMQSQTNGIRNLIMSNYFNQNIVLPSISKQNLLVTHIKAIVANIKKLQIEATTVLENAKQAVEKTILG